MSRQSQSKAGGFLESCWWHSVYDGVILKNSILIQGKEGLGNRIDELASKVRANRQKSSLFQSFYVGYHFVTQFFNLINISYLFYIPTTLSSSSSPPVLSLPFLSTASPSSPHKSPFRNGQASHVTQI